MPKQNLQRVTVSLTEKGVKSLHYVMRRYGYRTKSEAMESALNDRASHISKEIRAELDAMQEAYENTRISALEEQFEIMRGMLKTLSAALGLRDMNGGQHEPKQ